MTIRRARKPIAVLCIALVLCGTLLAAVSYVLHAAFVALWLVVPLVLVTVFRRSAPGCDEQSTPLFSIAAPRAPPARFRLA